MPKPKISRNHEDLSMSERDLKLKYRVIFLETLFNVDLKSLKELKKTLPPYRWNGLLNMKYDGKSALLIATENNSCDLVEFLLQECKVDPDQVGQVVIDNEQIIGASALWCAAAIGCLRCVKALIAHGANVNISTSTNSTPLRAACFDGHFDIVEYLVANNADIELANQHGHTCLMIACYKRHYRIARFLIEKGAQVNRQSMKGHTALHDCVAADDCLDIVDLLLDNGAKLLRDHLGYTPLMTAAISGNTYIVEYLIDYPKLKLDLTDDDREDALRLLGSTAVDKFNDFLLAFSYWEEALRVRNSGRAKFRELMNFGGDDVQRNFFDTGFDGMSEFETLEELDDIRDDPLKTHLQSLIIRTRILGVCHPDTAFYFRTRGISLVYMNCEVQCFALWMYILKEQHDISKPLSLVTQNSYISLIELLTHLLRDEKLRVQLKMCDIFRVWKLASEELLTSIDTMSKREPRTPTDSYSYVFPIHSGKFEDIFDCVRDGTKFNANTNPIDRQFLICIQLMGFMCQSKQYMCPNLYQEFRRSVRRFIRRDPRSSCKSNILHIMCFIRWSDLWMPPNLRWFFDIFILIVEMSPDLNDIDAAGNTALHFLFRDRYFKKTWMNLLIDRGAHLDVCNQAGRTPVDFLPEGDARWSKYKLLPLRCLCAQNICKKLLAQPSQSSCDETLETLPPDLKKFVELHMPRSMTVYPNEDN